VTARRPTPSTWPITKPSERSNRDREQQSGRLASRTYTLSAQAKDSDGVFGDPLALTLQVI
jgi:hypothetical protein